MDDTPALRRLGVMLVGLGPGSRPHAASLAALHAQAEVRWALCRHPEHADAGALAGRVTPSADLDAALADPAVEVAIVATPPATHLEIAGRCLAAGKHTLVEKPLETTLERAAALVARAEASGLRFGVVLQHRMREGALRLRALLETGELGAVQAASVRVPWWRPQAYYDEPGRGTRARDGGGVLLTQAIHALDLFRSLVGVREVVAAQVVTTAVHRMETEDYAAALLTLGNGAPGCLMATTAMVPGSAESIEIIGQRGSAVLAGGALRATWHDGREIRVESDGRSGGGANIMDFDPGPHRALIADFLDAVHSGREPAVTGADALATQRLIEEIVARGTRAAPTPTGS